MLVLSRRENETLYIGNDIVVKILKIKGGSVQIGIDAPPDVAIWREELAPFDADKKFNTKQ